ncbi:hypothetical protein [Mucilaginibacter flavus]|uniref:hypothetical protein n=1 Tax=Mucilaginibacter flavus TaxID=931504 RepID=UPI0025B5B0C8|nr:hypothetical protein [Mucilaginibacter flavus]MDN3583387.1 hypothetical protein [Mucilaginibacter flavus]
MLVQDLPVHQIGGRTKTIESLSKKIDDKSGKYSVLNDITDIVGIRIITYLESEVDLVADLVEKEFVKDLENSIDKRKLKADQFGYRSLHIVVSLNESRLRLKEYKRYKGLKCEIQVRSILQHAWAEIEHDLGYKGEVSIPEPYKRSFNRLSALLETADIEFVRLKSELIDYEKEVSNLIISQPEFVDINKASLNSFVNTNQVLLTAKTLIEDKIKKPLFEKVVSDNMIRALSYLKIDSIGKLSKLLDEQKERYERFLTIFIEDRLNENKRVRQYAPLIYFLHFLALQPRDKSFFEEYYRIANYTGNSFEKFDLYLNIFNDSEEK